MNAVERRLRRLEKQLADAASAFSINVEFVDPEKGVTSTLLLERDKCIWTNLEDEQSDAGAEIQSVRDLPVAAHARASSPAAAIGAGWNRIDICRAAPS